jgi:hypothetical protein
MALQVMGRAEILNWRMAFRSMSKKLKLSSETGTGNSLGERI